MAFDSKKEDGEIPDVGCMPYLVILLVSIILITLSMMALKKYGNLHSDNETTKEFEMLEMPNGHTYLLQDDGKLFHNPNCMQCKDSTWSVQEESIQ